MDLFFAHLNGHGVVQLETAMMQRDGLLMGNDGDSLRPCGPRAVPFRA
jgi:hypothetical protein